MNILNKAAKSGILVLVLSFSFFSPWSGLIVEGSPSTIINSSEQEILSADNEEFYHNSNDTFFTAVYSLQPSIETRKITVTAYSSTPDQTDDSPFITASGTWVYDGIVASNFLPFGTKIRFPELFRDKIFTVDDKMHERFTDTRVDIWFADRKSAKEFGIKETIMEILR
jgi:3D (Asp-Asp-Asp) domain-containing protein